jgi:hypothetical protein
LTFPRPPVPAPIPHKPGVEKFVLATVGVNP